MKSKVGAWIEAMRLRTLPVSVAGVFAGTAYAGLYGTISWLPAALCLAFAILAQIASNFANEYYDFKRGFDKAGREGPRRGVTEGDLTPAAMLHATFITLGLACAIGCSLIYWGGWWLLPIGILIAVGVLAYSTGPYPLSHHGLGEIAVVFFFGIIPVTLTYYVQNGGWPAELSDLVCGSVAIGLMGANVLIVNNYRDADDDRAVKKHTLAVIIGRKAVRWLYLANGIVAVVLMRRTWLDISAMSLIVPIVYLILHTLLFIRLGRLNGHRLNPLLGMTAVLMLAYSLAFFIYVITTKI